MTALNKQAHQTENERMAQSLAERNGEPVEGLRQRISELEEIATDYGMKFQKAQDALKHQALLHQSQMEAAEKRIAELREWNVGLAQESFERQQRIAELEARPANPINFKESADADYCRSWAWNEVKKELAPDDWTVGDNGTYYGFFCWGWDLRRQFNEQRAAGIGVKGE
ncbi:hypothetical protein [Citrobacter freundii]|uniref:hypothetical protein n=1 Tax=Citrobacter freundii TaxID=546 RepID=UPI0039908591